MIDFVIVSYNSLEYLPNVYRQIQKKFDDPDVTILDNASTDGSQKWLNKLKRARVLYRLDNIGYAPAANKASEYGINEYICFMNPDIDFTWFAIQGALIELDDPDVVIASPLELKENGEPRLYDGFAGGACMLIKRDWFEGVGGFNDKLEFGCDDIDICRRAIEQGYRWVVTEPPITHYGQRSHDMATKKKIEKSEAVLAEDWEVVVLEFVGVKEEYIIGVPARNLTRRDMVELVGLSIDDLTASGLYKEVQ